MNSGNRRQTIPLGFLRSALSSLSFFLFLAGLGAVGYATYISVDAQLYQAAELRKFTHPAPLAEPQLLTLGEVLGQIEIPSLDFRAIILHGDSPELLRRGIGHLPETPLPGELGNVALAGHRDTFFRPLRRIRAGDLITLRTFKGENFQYRVESMSIVSPADVDVLRSSDRRQLTLITCFPFNYLGSAPNRFIVRAFQVPSAVQ